MNRLFPFYRGIQTDALETTTMAACHPIYTARYETAEIGKLRQSANQNSFRPIQESGRGRGISTYIWASIQSIQSGK